MYNFHTNSLGIAPFCQGACLQTSQDLQVMDPALFVKATCTRSQSQLKQYKMHENNDTSLCHVDSFNDDIKFNTYKRPLIPRHPDGNTFFFFNPLCTLQSKEYSAGHQDTMSPQIHANQDKPERSDTHLLAL